MAREWWKEERRERERKRTWRIIDDSIDYIVYYITKLRIRVTYIAYVLRYEA